MPPKPWVLVVDDGDSQSRTALVAARALDAGGYAVAATVSGPRSLVGASRSCSRAVLVPPIDDPGFDEALARAMAAGRYECVLPASDVALAKLEPEAAALSDKQELAARCARAGIPTPESTPFDDPGALLASADKLSYPIALKPVRSVWRPYRVDTADELRASPPPSGPLLVQPYLSGTLRAVGGVMWRGELVAAVHQRYLRTWPPAAGGASAAVSVAPDEALEERLERLLGGRDGIFMAQLVDDVLLDLNPRVYGSLPLAVSAGVNLAAIHCDLVRGGAAVRRRGRPGVTFRFTEGDLRHVVSQVRAKAMSPGEALRALRPRRGVAHPVESLRDPGPLLARLRFALGKARR